MALHITLRPGQAWLGRRVAPPKCAARLVWYKVPRKVWSVPDLFPCDAGGKLLSSRVRGGC